MASITTPVTVVAQPYDTSGNGGRKLVRLSNGWLVAVAHYAGNYYFYKSQDNGKTWSQLCSIANGSHGVGGALASKDTTVYFLAPTSAGSTVQFWAFDATTQSNVNIYSTGRKEVDTSQTGLVMAVSLDVASDGTLHAVWASKNNSLPNSFNIRYSKSTDGGQAWMAPTQVTSINSVGTEHTDPCVVVRPDNNPTILYRYYNGSSIYSIKSHVYNGSSWNVAVDVMGTTPYAQSSPCALVKKYGSNVGRIFVGWHGLDSTDTTKHNVRIAYSDDGGATWTVIGKITTGNTVDRKNVTLTEDANGNVYAIYEDNRTIKFQVCPDGTTTFGDLTTIESGTNPSALESGAFATVPVIYKTTTSVKFHGSFNNPPAITLTSPTDNQVLSEGNVFSIQGSAGDTDSGNVVTVKYKINSGTTRAIASGVSDGSSPISFSKALTYSNKRLFDGSTDIVGADLAEGVDHTLTVWVEDDQGGKSAEVTRKFRVIWNRPPVISGQNEDLGTIMEPPVRTYTVEDPEGNPFVITEKIDGQVIRTFPGVPGQEETITIPHDMWIRLDLDVPHELTVEATDSQGLTSTRTFTFVRTETHIEFMLNFDNPAVEAHFTLDGMPKRVLVKLERYLPPGSEIEFVRVTNNAMDEEPVWEDTTAAVLAGRGHLFQNQQKTADSWRINIWVCITKGTATERVLLNGYGGAFD